MALWLIRAGRHGQHEQKFLDDDRVYVTQSGLNTDLSSAATLDDLRALLRPIYATATEPKIRNHASQIWALARRMEVGDWAIIPSKSKATVHIAEIAGPYSFNAAGPDPYFHYRKVKWIAHDVARQRFAQDLLYSMGAFMTICKIKRNDAEARVRRIITGGSSGKPSIESISNSESAIEATADEPTSVDLEQLARDAIAKLIQAKFKGHGLAELVDAILRAQGYTTFLSPPGADKGVDILAAPEPLGFGEPRLCVQVKSEQTPIDRATLDQLIGAMQNFNAKQGLLVAWGGFKSSVMKELPAQFFRVRLWDQQTLIDQLVEHYDKLDPDIRAEIPLKRIWTIAAEDPED